MTFSAVSKMPRRLLTLLLVLSGLILACKNEPPPIIPPPDEPADQWVQYGTPFAAVPATEDIIMYEVNLRAFSATGDLPGVTARLDALDALGVNVIWLMPIHPIGAERSVNSPYSVQDYLAVGAEYGDLEDLRTLTDEAHTRGMAVIMDWVANHTAWDHPWIDKRSWYTQDANGSIVHPPGTNWQDVADLNYDNRDMRAAMIDAMMYWVYEANVDGYRCDYADGVPFDFWSEAIDSLESIPNREIIMLAEGARDDHFEAGFDLNFGWAFYAAMKAVYAGQPVSRLFSAHQNSYQGTPPGHHWLRFTTNHDESAWDATPISLFDGAEGALAASVTTMFLGGVPLIYTGQEVGTAQNVPFFSNAPINWANNPDLLAAYEDILQVYAASEVARAGDLTAFLHDDVACFRKVLNGAEMLVLVNHRDSPQTYALPVVLQNSAWTDALRGTSIALDSLVELPAFGFFILLE
ncbi:MAG: alpha-amylase [Bacteroidetes bacterium]|nr:MAG: alpha-amylase [Bacteroidota bacterium]